MYPAIPRTAALSKTGVLPVEPSAPPLQPLLPPPTQEPVLVRIGDIAVTPSWVLTPVGRLPLVEARWEYRDDTHTYRRTPGWAILLGICTFPFGLPLLFVKQSVTWGRVQVAVRGPGLEYAPMIPIHSRFQAIDLAARVRYAHTLISSNAPWR